MVGTPQFIDISSWQGENIDWTAYVNWAKQWDGIARVAMRATYGLDMDVDFPNHRENALSHGVQQIYYYGYAYPQLNSAVAEAIRLSAVVGSIRPDDSMQLDLEEQVPAANAGWAYAWLSEVDAKYGKKSTIYASDAYIRARLQDDRLAIVSDLWLAYWGGVPTFRPPCPP